MKQLFIALILLTSLASCKKEEVDAFKGEDFVQFSRQSTNPNIAYIESQDYSFASKGSLESETIFIPIDVTGRSKTFDREVKVEVIAGETTAKQGVDFELGPGIIKAGEFKGFVAVTLKKTPILDTERKLLTFKIVESADFKPGIAKQLRSQVAFFNFMVKPITWESRMINYFGKYSKVKHRFILYFLGYPEINIVSSGIPEDEKKYIFSGTKFILFQIRLRSILTDLNNGVLKPGPTDPFTYPLMDEDGQPVVIP